MTKDEKQRYSFNDDRTLLRANQGHSIPVDVELEEVIPPEIIFSFRIFRGRLLIIEKPANPFFLNGLDSEVLSVYTEEKYRGKGIYRWKRCLTSIWRKQNM